MINRNKTVRKLFFWFEGRIAFKDGPLQIFAAVSGSSSAEEVCTGIDLFLNQVPF